MINDAGLRKKQTISLPYFFNLLFLFLELFYIKKM